MEQFDLVDIDDNIIGVTDKPTAHASKQLHRVAVVYVFNDSGELYIQVHKTSGGLYDHSVGGHVSRGEDYATAARREAKEELSITQPLTQLAIAFHSDEGKYGHMFGLFECIAEKSWKFIPNDEVEEIIPMKFEDIRHLMETNPENFTGGFINTMKEYCKIKGLQ
jgi:isopentenyldiphosphate isomerase